MRIKPKNWRDFQHYKDRSPPWIRLHRRLLDDKDFQRLPVASRALAPMLWLLASESMDGWINADPDELAFRLRTTEKDITQALKPLLERGFFVMEQDASTVLADCPQVAVPETETEAETEAIQRQKAPAGAKGVYPKEFEDAWTAYPTRPGNSKADAFKAWNARIKDGAESAAIVDGVKRYAAYCEANRTEARFIKQAATFFGPSLHYQDPWEVASSSPAGHTVPSRAADETARYLAERREQEQHATLPPAALLAKVRGAVKTEAA